MSTGSFVLGPSSAGSRHSTRVLPLLDPRPGLQRFRGVAVRPTDGNQLLQGGTLRPGTARVRGKRTSVGYADHDPALVSKRRLSEILEAPGVAPVEKRQRVVAETVATARSRPFRVASPRAEGGHPTILMRAASRAASRSGAVLLAFSSVRLEFCPRGRLDRPREGLYSSRRQQYLAGVPGAAHVGGEDLLPVGVRHLERRHASRHGTGVRQPQRERPPDFAGSARPSPGIAPRQSRSPMAHDSPSRPAGSSASAGDERNRPPAVVWRPASIPRPSGPLPERDPLCRLLGATTPVRSCPVPDS